ncbi:MAG: hypothetical protein OWU32_04670 [Firmicutes bacterium]|nr:hypothetical protein [Bacillota bacterium]
MSIVQFVVVMIVPVCVGIYAFNFSRWLWNQGNHLGGVGGYLMTVLSGGGAFVYFLFKLLI